MTPPAFTDPADTPAGRHALATYFNQDRSLFLRYHRLSCTQFGRDLPRLDAAMASGDWALVAQRAHWLKPTLSLIGHEALAEHAGALEQAALTPDAAALAHHWPVLRHGLQQLAESLPSP